MSHVRIVVDNEVLLDDNLDTWQDRATPSFVRDLLVPGTQPKLYLMAVGLVLSQLALANRSGTITVVTSGVDKWNLEVETS
jgi:hypothetical protein